MCDSQSVSLACLLFVLDIPPSISGCPSNDTTHQWLARHHTSSLTDAHTPRHANTTQHKLTNTQTRRATYREVLVAQESLVKHRVHHLLPLCHLPATARVGVLIIKRRQLPAKSCLEESEQILYLLVPGLGLLPVLLLLQLLLAPAARDCAPASAAAALASAASQASSSCCCCSSWCC